MSSFYWPRVCLLCATIVASGCVPIPVSTVPLQPREERPIAVESAQSENSGTFSSPVFDTSGVFVAAYDSGSNLVRIYRSSDLTQLNSLKPTRRPRRLSFSPSGHFLVIEAHQGWVEDYLQGKSLSNVEIDSPEAIRDDIQRVEVWNLETGQTVHDLTCDAVEITEPSGGWLWARKKAISPGYRSSAILGAYFSSDETEFSILCWNGVQQRWDSSNWKRIEDIPSPPFWDSLTPLVNALYWAQNPASSQSADGRIAVLSVREKRLGFGTTYVWNRNKGQVQPLPGECATRYLPVYSLSSDGSRIVVICNNGLGCSVRAWDLVSGQEILLKNVDFGITRGAPLIRSEGVAISPDGRYLAVALLNLTEALVVTPLPIPLGISRCDLRLWSLEDGKELVSIPIDDLIFYSDYFRGADLAFSPDSALLAVGGKRLRIYRLSDLSAF